MLLSRILKIFLVLYILALAAWLVGTLGLFGAERDPLSGVFLVLLGQPWVLLVDYFPEYIWPLITAITPMMNLAVIYLLAKRFG